MKRTNTMPSDMNTTKKAAIAPVIRTYYCGETKSGRIKLMRDGVVMYGTGSLYEVMFSRIVKGKRKIKLNVTPVRSTLNFEPQSGSNEKRIACVGRKSGREFRFVGSIELRKHWCDVSQPVAGISGVGVRLESAPQTERQRLAEGLQLIATARSTGFDPSLKLNQVCAILQESRSSVYRKIALGVFPPPIKRGKGSFWLLSHIERYATGNWLSVAEPGQ